MPMRYRGVLIAWMAFSSIVFMPVQAAEQAPGGASESRMPSQEWRMMPGESLASLAALIYPKSTTMQQRFVAATFDLNRAKLANRSAHQAFDEETSIRIPDLRSLSWPGGAWASPDASSGIVSRKRSSEAPLLQRNEKRQRELEGLNVRLEELEAQAERVQKLLSETAPPPIVEQGEAGEDKIAQGDAPEGKPLKRVTAPEMDIPGGTGSLNLMLMVIGMVLLLAGLAAYVWHRKHHKRGKKLLTPVAAAPSYSNPFMSDAPAPAAVAGNTPSPAPAAPPRVNPVIQIDDISVDEIESVVDEARVIVALGRTSNAIRLLVDHIQSHPRASVTPWLYLLELYRATDNRKEFDETGRRLHENFNVMVPAWNAGDVSKTVPRSLEEFPQVIKRIIESWGLEACSDYLAHLVQDNRDGERIGFSPEVLQEILLLQQILEQRDSMPG